MSIYEKWQDLINNQSEKDFEKFWDEYSSAEVKIYNDILSNPSKTVTGTFGELMSGYGVSDVMFMGFLDGVGSSLKNGFDPEGLKTMDEGSPVEIIVDFEVLYRNMLAAEAEHLYTIEAWDGLLTETRREEITKEYKRSTTVVKEKTPGRNDPCFCGSGKKYKKCCM